MSNVTIFNAKAWIIGNCPGADVLRPETLDVVSNFTLLWNLFEKTLCQTKANIGTLDHIAQTIAHRDLPNDVKDGVQFWANRFRTGSKFNALFEDLHFRRGDRRDHVEAVLSGILGDPYSQLLGVMIIVYRLRSNLFHGMKTILTLNDQVSNLDMACRVLAAIIQTSGQLT